MRTVYAGITNLVTLDLVAKASGNPITAGTVNFYLIANSGANIGKWYLGSGPTWEASASIAGAATHKDDGHWQLSLASAVWTRDVTYTLYAKESGSLHIAASEDVVCMPQAGQYWAAWFMGNTRDKPGETNTKQVLDFDGTTPLFDVVAQATTPQRTVTKL